MIERLSGNYTTCIVSLSITRLGGSVLRTPGILSKGPGFKSPTGREIAYVYCVRNPPRSEHS